VLQITPGAAALLTEIRQGSEVPDDYGLRVYPEAAESGEVTIGIGFTDAPATGDQVSDQEGLRVFVAPELAAPLDQAAIDVAEQDGASRLVFRPQAPEASQAS
jgi:Fe-S cluster assembly iron-binding protein IscA